MWKPENTEKLCTLYPRLSEEAVMAVEKCQQKPSLGQLDLSSVSLVDSERCSRAAETFSFPIYRALKWQMGIE